MKEVLALIIIFCTFSALGSETLSCYDNAKRGRSLTASGAISLCNGTNDASETLSCYDNAKRGRSLTAAGAISLCNGTNDASETLSCYDNAKRGRSLTASGAISLCSAAVYATNSTESMYATLTDLDTLDIQSNLEAPILGGEVSINRDSRFSHKEKIQLTKTSQDSRSSVLRNI